MIFPTTFLADQEERDIQENLCEYCYYFVPRLWIPIILVRFQDYDQ